MAATTKTSTHLGIWIMVIYFLKSFFHTVISSQWKKKKILGRRKAKMKP
jgi:hypothetical protein